MTGWVGGWSRQEPGGVEVGDELGGSLAVRASRLSFCGKLVVRSWKRTRPTSDGVAGCPGGGLVAEEAELEREVRALGFHGGVDAAGVELEPAHLVGREGGVGAVGGGADLEGALEAVVGDHALAEDLGHVAGDEAAEGCPSARGGPGR